MFLQGNDFDEGGLLSGNWSGDYSGGTKPTHWQGSLKICQQYLETNRPVKFGQCWVFSGILNSCKLHKIYKQCSKAWPLGFAYFVWLCVQGQTQA